MTKEKVYLITGSTQGIGREVARQLLFAGNKVCLNGRSANGKTRVEDLFISFPGQVLYASGDISNDKEAEDIILSCTSTFGRLDAIILNAGLSAYGNVGETEPALTKTIFGANVLGNFFLLKSALPHLMKTKGSILLISSLAGVHGLPGYSLYSASKMALTALFQSLDTELDGTGVFTGITYVWFTENEPEKRTYSPDGKSEPVPQRNQFTPFSRELTAKKIIHQLNTKKRISVHSFSGKMIVLFARLFPGTYRFIQKKIHRKRSEK